MTDSEPDEPPTKTSARASAWRVAVATMIGGIVAFIVFIAVRAVLPAKWEFSVEIETDVVEVRLRPKSETQWLIDDATLCLRSELDLPSEYRVTAAANPCGSRAWQPWKIPLPEQVVKLNGGTSAVIQSMPDGGFAMSLRASEGEDLGTLSVVGIVEDARLGTALNLLWEPQSVTSRTFPFSGTTTLGRAVTWSDSRLLRSGTVAVYTADESADKRTLVDDADLMLGDQVRLGEPEPGRAWPKGFIRFSGNGGPMQVVAFGRADSMHIERFGDRGYDFKPGFISKLASDPAIAFWGSLLAAYMTLILSLQAFIDGDTVARLNFWQRFSGWFRKKHDRD